jgi:hypothetical protein
MLVRTWRFITIMLAALLLGTTFCHVLELPAKMEYPASLYLTLHRTLYAAFGPPGPGPYIEIGAILGAGVLVFLVRGRRPAFTLTLLGAGCLVAGLVVYFAVIEPANATMKQWVLETPPAEWTRLRDQWEYGHTVHFVLHLAGLAAMVLSVLLETPAVPATVRRESEPPELPEPTYSLVR